MRHVWRKGPHDDFETCNHCGMQRCFAFRRVPAGRCGSQLRIVREYRSGPRRPWLWCRRKDPVPPCETTGG
jgi:hypothetical protein